MTGSCKSSPFFFKINSELNSKFEIIPSNKDLFVHALAPFPKFSGQRSLTKIKGRSFADPLISITSVFFKLFRLP